MPSIDESSLQEYPILGDYLRGDTPIEELLASNVSPDTRYSVLAIEVFFDYSERRTLSLLQIMCLYGKLTDLAAYSLTAEAQQALIRADNYLAIRLLEKHGQLETFKHGLSLLPLSERAEAIKDVIDAAASSGHLDILKHCLSFLGTQQQKEILRTFSYSVISSAARQSHLETLEYCLSLLDQNDPNDQKARRKAGQAAIYFGASEGHVAILKYGASLLEPDNQAAPMKAMLSRAVELAARSGRIEVFKIALSLLEPSEQAAALRQNKYYVFEIAARHGYAAVFMHGMSRLESCEQAEAIRASEYLVIDLAAHNNTSEIFMYALSLIEGPEQVKAMRAQDYRAIRSALVFGHVDILRHGLSLLEPSEQLNPMRANQYMSIRIAATMGHVESFKHALSLFEPSEQAVAMRVACVDLIPYHAIRSAAKKGHLETFKYALSLLGAGKQKEVLRNYGIICSAAAGGHLETLKHALSFFEPREQRLAMRTMDYLAIRLVVENGHLATLEHCVSLFGSGEASTIPREVYYLALNQAAQNGHLETLQYCLSLLSLDEQVRLPLLRNIIANAASRGHWHIVWYFLDAYSLTVFDHMSQHDFEYGKRYIHPFVSRRVARLAARKAAFEAADPDAVFDVEEDEALLLLKIIKNLISRGMYDGDPTSNQAHLMDKINFLITIPSIAARLHQPVTDGGQENELLRHAMHIGHNMAATALMSVPEVRRIAAAHDFYQGDEGGALDLRALAADTESAMTALSHSEERSLNKLKAHYQPEIDRLGGQLGVLDLLFKDLKTRYAQAPATIECKGARVVLPFEWSDFQSMDLSEADYSAALKAYHSHQAHSVYRYCLKPNPWMHEHASYVYVLFDEANRVVGKYSTFEAYLALIAPLYLASIDKNIGVVDGYTPESRADFFIAQMALIARAHNWDNSRDTGRVNKYGARITEEYDNLEGDRPSCFSGVKRRLFQSLLGHPLLQVLTGDIIRQALRSHLRELYQVKLSKLTHTQLQALKRAYEKEVINTGKSDNPCFAALKLTDEEKASLTKVVLEQLCDAYQAFWTPEERNGEIETIQNTLLRRLALPGQSAVPDFVFLIDDASDLLETALSDATPPGANAASDGAGSASAEVHQTSAEQDGHAVMIQDTLSGDLVLPSQSAVDDFVFLLNEALDILETGLPDTTPPVINTASDTAGSASAEEPARKKGPNALPNLKPGPKPNPKPRHQPT